MLQEFSRRGKKNGQTNLVAISGRVPVLNLNLLTASLGFSLRWKICQKTAMEVVDFAVDFCGGFFGRKMQKKNPPKKSARKSASRKQKIRRRTTPRNPPARPKNPPQNLPTNPPFKPPSTRWVFSIEKDRSWRRLQSMDSGHSLAAFWAWSRLPCRNAPAIPQLLLAGWTSFSAHPFRQHL